MPLLGGWRQQLGREAESAEPVAESHLAKALIEKWAWGEMSAVTIQQLASAAAQDMLHDIFVAHMVFSNTCLTRILPRLAP